MWKVMQDPNSYWYKSFSNIHRVPKLVWIYLDVQQKSLKESQKKSIHKRKLYMV